MNIYPFLILFPPNEILHSHFQLHGFHFYLHDSIPKIQPHGLIIHKSIDRAQPIHVLRPNRGHVVALLRVCAEKGGTTGVLDLEEMEARQRPSLVRPCWGQPEPEDLKREPRTTEHEREREREIDR